MIRPLLAAAILLSAVAVAAAQQGPVPLYANPSQPPQTIEGEQLPPVSPEPPASPAPSPAPAAPGSAALMPPSPSSPPAERVFCGQSINTRIAAPESEPERYRPFIGIFSDAAWTPQLCAALVVESVNADGTARIVYAFGPMGSKDQGSRGVLRGTGIVRDGELRFQNSDGSQFSFRPLYADLQGRLTTPQGQTFQAVFERTP